MRNSLRVFIGFVFIATGVGLAPPTVRGADGPYVLSKEIAIGGEGGWDYISVDAAGRRLYVSHATKVVVVDIDAEKVVGEIADTPGVHGFAIASELGRGFASNGREAKVSIVDLKTLATIAKVETGENPDAILYEPGRQEVYAFNGRGQSATVFEAKTGKVVATIPLGGKPEFGVADAKAGRVFVNIEDKNNVSVIDTQSHQVVASWPLAPGEEPSGLAIDEKNHRLFAGCGNKLMVMMDSTTGKVVGSVPIGPGVDANSFDGGTRLAFASSSDSTLTVAHLDSPDKLTVVQSLKTVPRARTMTLDPKTHNLYVTAGNFEPQAEAAPGTPPQRPKLIPGSFRILVYSTSAH